MKALREEIADVKNLNLTARGRLVRDAATAAVAVPLLYAGVLLSIFSLEKMGL